MIKKVFTLAAITILGTFAAAQGTGIPQPTKTGLMRSWETSGRPRNYPPFCPPQDCLYYAGDYDTNYSGANGLFNSDYESGAIVGQAWVGIKPDHDVTVTGVTFVEQVSSGYQLVNPTPVAIQVGIRPGQPGKTVCTTSGIATTAPYGKDENLLTLAITIDRLRTACKLKKGALYYVNLLPISNVGYGYLWNVPPKPQNHDGWRNDRNHCYYNSATMGYSYVPCNELGEFSELDIALTGKK